MSKDISHAALCAFDNAIVASPDNKRLKAARAQLQHELADLPVLRARLAAIEEEMSGSISDVRRAQRLLRVRKQVLSEIETLEGPRS